MSVRVKPYTCLKCKAILDAATGVSHSDSDIRPHDGMVSICGKCGNLAIFNSDQTIREMTDIDLNGIKILHPKDYEIMMRVSDEIKLMNAKFHVKDMKADAVCPHCKKKMPICVLTDNEGVLNHPASVNSGSIGICNFCGTPSQFDKNMCLIEVPMEFIDSIRQKDYKSWKMLRMTIQTVRDRNYRKIQQN